MAGAVYNKTVYHYSGAQLDVTGRGFLGFAEMQATDPETPALSRPPPAGFFRIPDW
ncbi:MAG: hypothetical protein R3F37_17330 [Candidatus Competibacteraceae bacterium]